MGQTRNRPPAASYRLTRSGSGGQPSHATPWATPSDASLTASLVRNIRVGRRCSAAATATRNATVTFSGSSRPVVKLTTALPLIPSPFGDPPLRMRMSRDGARAHRAATLSLRPDQAAQPLDDGGAEGQSVFSAASGFCAAVLTWRRADTTPDAVLTPGLAPKLVTAVLSVSSAALSALVCVWNLPCVSVTSFVR